MSKKLLPVISLFLILMFVFTACTPKATEAPAEVAPTKAPVEEPAATEAPAEVAPTEAPAAEPVALTLWTKEGETDGGLQYVKSLSDAFTAENPNITFEVVNKDVEVLREDFQTTSLAGNPPDILWTVNDHAGPFTAADLIMEVSGLVDLSQYVDSAVAAVTLNDKAWGVPISNGNHLMLIYNKSIVPTPPKDTDEMISIAKEITKDGTYGLVFNQTEPFWLVPWLGGFSGSVFAEDGVTPTLNTPEMVATLNFLHKIKYDDKIIPQEGDYDSSDALFKEGKAGMIINGDWSVGGYKEVLGDNLGIAPLPKIVETGKMPAPYTAGVFFMMPNTLEGARLEAVKQFITFATNHDNQMTMYKTLARLPGLKTALASEEIANDPLLAGSAEQMTYGTPMPTVLEMRCNWDSMKPEMQAVLADQKSAEDAALAMQTAADACVAALE